MKKIITIIMLVLCTLNINAQQINYSKPYVECGFILFHVPTESSVGELGFIGICTDKLNKNIWLKHEVMTPHNVDEFVDNKGRHICGEYTISVGKHIYLKLDNNEIITLTCKYRSKIHRDYYVSSTGIYKQYDMYSYFLLNSNIIQKLKTNKIVKMRCEMKFEVKDMKLDDDIDFNKSFNKLNTLYKEQYNKDHNINQLNNNPLKDF